MASRFANAWDQRVIKSSAPTVAGRSAVGKLASGAGYVTLGAILSQLLSAISSVVTARILSVAAFGELGFVRSTLMMFGVLAGTGLGLVATRQVARTREADPGAAGAAVALLQWIAIGSGILVAALVCATSTIIAERYAGERNLAPALRLGSVLLGLNAYNGVQLGAIAGCDAFSSVAVLAVADGALSVIMIPTGALVAGVRGAIVATVVVATFGSWLKHRVLVAVATQHSIVLCWRAVDRVPADVWRAVVPALLLGIIVQPFEWATRVTLTRSGGFAEMGIFTAAYTWGQFVAFLPAQVSGPAMPILANLYSKERIRSFVKLLAISGSAAIGLGACVAFVGVVASNQIVVIYGNAFLTARPVLNALFLAYGLGSASAFLRSVLVATGRLWSQALHALLWGVALVGWFTWSASPTALALAKAYAVAFGVAVVTQSISAAWALKTNRLLACDRTR